MYILITCMTNRFKCCQTCNVDDRNHVESVILIFTINVYSMLKYYLQLGPTVIRHPNMLVLFLILLISYFIIITAYTPLMILLTPIIMLLPYLV